MTRYGYMISLTSGAQSGTGTLTASGAGDVTIEGYATAFTTELAVGSIIVCAGQTWSVASIQDNDSLTINVAATAAVSNQAFTYINLTNVETLNTVDTRNYAPKSTFRPYTDSVSLANGRVRGLGRPIASWRWGYIPLHMRTALRTYCPNPSKSYDVYIRTRTNEADAYAVYSAVVLWPDDEDKDAGRRIGFVLEFRNLVAI